jgi:hypothetical protein
MYNVQITEKGINYLLRGYKAKPKPQKNKLISISYIICTLYIVHFLNITSSRNAVLSSTSYSLCLKTKLF